MSDFKTAMVEASRLMLVKREHQKRTAAIERSAERFDEAADLEQDDADIAAQAYFDAREQREIE